MNSGLASCAFDQKTEYPIYHARDFSLLVDDVVSIPRNLLSLVLFNRGHATLHLAVSVGRSHF